MGERRGPSRVAGPSDAGAAMTMGNSLEMWDRVYDTNFKEGRVGGQDGSWCKGA